MVVVQRRWEGCVVGGCTERAPGRVLCGNRLTAMCSLDWTGWKPTNEICIDRMVPRVYICKETPTPKLSN